LQRHAFGIRGRAGIAGHLDPALVELPLPARLGPLAAEHRPEVVDPGILRARALRGEVTGYARRALRPQGQAAPTPVLQGVHLLLHHIRPIAQRTHEDLRSLKDRGADLTQSVAGKQFPRHVLHEMPLRHLREIDIRHP